MPYSNFSDGDLLALKSQDFSKMSDEGLIQYQKLKQGQKQAQQDSTKNPFQTATNQDVAKGPKGPLRTAADMATAGAVGLGQGGSLGMSRQMEPWEKEATDEHPDITAAGRGIGAAGSSALAGLGIGKGLGMVANAGANVLENGVKGSLVKLLRGVGNKLSPAAESAAPAASSASEVGTAASASGSDVSIADMMKNRAANKDWNFPIRQLKSDIGR